VCCNLHVAPDDPSKLLQLLRQRVKGGLFFGIVRGKVHEHADAAHPLGLLRPPHHRPRRRVLR
jgi:hypothetical protein